METEELSGNENKTDSNRFFTSDNKNPREPEYNTTANSRRCVVANLYPVTL